VFIDPTVGPSGPGGEVAAKNAITVDSPAFSWDNHLGPTMEQ